MSDVVPGQVADPNKTQISHAAVPFSSGQELLVIEDDPMSRSALARLLQRGGFHVNAFATAGEALDWLGSDDGLASNVYGGVIDIHLPDADGIDLTRQLRRRLGESPRIVVVSGDTTMATISRLRDAGADGFLGKPLQFQGLLDALFSRE